MLSPLLRGTPFSESCDGDCLTARAEISRGDPAGLVPILFGAIIKTVTDGEYGRSPPK